MPARTSAGGGGGPATAESGAVVGDGRILRMKLTNFLIHRDVELRPGLHLNLIIGPNGSGKSTIVSAMCLGLAGDPKVLDRQKKLTQFILRGETKATIEIELQRGSGSVTVKRTIETNGSPNGATSWFIDSARKGEKEVKALAAALNIQISNLCQFVPQERVSAFAEMSPQELLLATEEAAGGEETRLQHEQLVQLGIEERDLFNKRENMEEELAGFKGRLEALKPDFERYQEREAQGITVKMLKMKRPWVVYEAKRLAFEQVKKERDTAKELVKQAKRQAGPAVAELEAAKKKQAAKEKELDHEKGGLGKLQKTVASALSKVERCNDSLENHEGEVEQCERALQKYQKLLVKTERQLVEYQETMEQTGSTDFKPQLTVVNKDLAAIKRELTAYQRKVQDVEEEKSGVFREVRNVQKKLKQLTDLKDAARTRLLKRDRNAEGPLAWLESNSDQFKEKLFEPICLQITVKEKKNAKFVEGMISQADLQGFIAQSNDDHEKFMRAMESNKLRVTAFKAPRQQTIQQPNWTLEDIAGYGFTGVVSDMFEAPPPVMAYLLFSAKLHCIPIGPASLQDKAEELFKKFGIRKFIAGNFTVNTMQSEYGKRAINVKISAIRESNNYSLLGASADMDQQKRLVQQKNELGDQMRQYEEEIAEIKTEEQQKRQAESKMVAQRDKLKDMHKAAQMAEQKCTRCKITIKGANQEISSNEREMANIVKKRDGLVQALFRELAKMKGECMKVTEAVQLVARIKLEYQDLKVQVRAKQAAYEDLGRQHTELMARQEELEEKYKELKAEAREAIRDAKKICNVATQPTPEMQDAFEKYPNTVGEIDELIHVEEAKLECQAEIDPNIVAEYHETEDEVKNHEKKQKRMELEYSKVSETIAEIKAVWIPKMEAMIKSINTGFSKSFERLKCLGACELIEHETDYAQYGIAIMVRFRDSQKLQRLQASVQSGGEKSVATMLYLMALQSLTRCPFRVVDEINQGMDAKNERMIYEQVFHASENTETSQYFIISPKLLPNLAYRASMRVLCVFNGLYVEDTEKATSSHKRAKTAEMVHRKRNPFDRLTNPSNR